MASWPPCRLGQLLRAACASLDANGVAACLHAGAAAAGSSPANGRAPAHEVAAAAGAAGNGSLQVAGFILGLLLQCGAQVCLLGLLLQWCGT